MPYRQWGRFNRRNRTAGYVAAVEALQALVESEGVESAQRAAGEALSDPLFDLFREETGLSPSGGAVCVRRLKGRQCRWETCAEAGRCQPPGSDHAQLWTKDRQGQLLTSQPYSLTQQELTALLAFCEEEALSVSIGPFPSWHFPGRTLPVYIRPQEKGGRE